MSMEVEQDRAVKALQYALQMEIDGKKFYLKASQESSNELGRKLLESLASEEDIHRRKFEEIYSALRRKRAWPETDFRPDGGRGLRTILAQAMKGDSDLKAATTELDDVQTAMGMENKTYDFYKEQSQAATYDSEKDFYEALAAEEREHYLVLLDYQEYLKDPAAWFVQREHPSLDGG
jgi:rubrerythrin